jgi:negative regulator of sigma E activity
MKDDIKLQLQAYLDGELSERESHKISEQLIQDSEAKAMLAELKFIKDAMRGNEPELKLPESREFYWSKIQREIERGAKQEKSESCPGFGWWETAFVGVGRGFAAGFAVLMF